MQSQKTAAIADMSRKLGLSKQQQNSVLAIMNKVEADMKKVAASKATDKEKRTRMAAIGVDGQKKFMAVLTSAQRKKLQDTMHAQMEPAQRHGPGPHKVQLQPVQQKVSFADAMQRKLGRLKLTETQKTKTDAIMKDFVKKHTALKHDPKIGANRREKANELKGQTIAKIKAVLTPSQIKEFEKRL